ncbi:hypothetical protein D3C85_555750 [compost metagenome]
MLEQCWAVRMDNIGTQKQDILQIFKVIQIYHKIIDHLGTLGSDLDIWLDPMLMQG